MTQSTFQTLGLAEPLLRALAAEGYDVPTPIQAQAIPLILDGRDVLGLARTGTGKTAAFGLPLLQQLAADGTAPEPRSARALILAPTRELAVQIYDSLRTYGGHLRLRHAVVLGGVGINRQAEAMRRGVDVLVATPGRLLDLVEQGLVKLDTASTLVIDEADRMFDMGFIRDVRRIVRCLPRQRQSMLFSATMPNEVAHLVAEVLDDPARVAVSPVNATAERIEQRVHFVAARDKRALLIDLLRDEAMRRVIVFTRTKHGANRVAEVLERAGHSADAIHGNKSQNARQRALDGFRAGRVRVLVATDIAARGIDVDAVTHVVNYELPDVPESYVHRIGRTARAGSGGVAIALCDPSERDSLRAIERLVKQPVTVVSNDDVAPQASARPPAPVQEAPQQAAEKPRNRPRRRNRQRRDTRRAA